MKEIGGFFELENISKDFFDCHKNAIKINLARNCLVYLIRSKNIKSILIPYYLCESIENICRIENVSIEKYHINKNFYPKVRRRLKENEYLYVVNYFGALSNKNIKELKKRYLNIIVDNVHAFYQLPIDNKTDTLYSCRKFFGVPDGAFLYTNGKAILLGEDDSSSRFSHLIGRKNENAQKFFKKYQENEAVLDITTIKYMSKQTAEIINHINHNHVKIIRQKNYNYLNKKLKHINKLTVKVCSIPFCYPLYLDNGKQIKKTLILNKIYVPTLWPNIRGLSNLEKKYVDNIILLPCDQRYGIADMKYIVDIVAKEMANENKNQRIIYARRFDNK